MASNQQIMAIVSSALSKAPGAERDRFLQEACAGDAVLEAEVREAIEASEQSLSDLTCTELVAPPEGTGSRIGPYKILQEIGEGGCGIVYMAEQEEPIRRRVALKVIKLGMDSRQVIARFEAERQALAMMDHPNIAMVLDAGTTTSGRPYFVMELVRGVPITRYCDEARLDVPTRLKLFIEVCKAIQHAHQKGIIHRDIKPSNVLVMLADGVPVPKVIDFGIAKATEGKLTDKTLFTNIAQFIGTPAYMSPEQAGLSELDIDTRSDIYSLGVLLYELLVGSPPFDPETLARSGVDEARRRIREDDPPKPSTRLRTIAGEPLKRLSTSRGGDVHGLLRSVDGDLDWIVMRALEKERTRRYSTANDLAGDLERFLSNEPIHARPPSNVYRLRKFARRNRVAFFAAVFMSIAALVVIVVMAVGLFVSTRLLLREREARRLAAEARQEAALTEAEVIAFGDPDLIERVTRARTSRGQLEEATEYLNASRLVDAEALLDDLLERASPGGPFSIQILGLHADLRARQGRFTEAATDLGRVIELEPEEHWNWFLLAPLLVQIGDDDAYENVRRAMLEQFRATDDPLAAERVAKAALLRPLETSQFEAIAELERTFVEAADREYLADEFSSYRDAFQLCSALVQLRCGDLESASGLARLAKQSPYVLYHPTADAILAISLQRQQRPLEAQAALSQGLQTAERVARLDYPDLSHLWNDVLIANIMLKEAAEVVEQPRP